MDNKFLGLLIMFFLFILLIPSVSAIEVNNDTLCNDSSGDVISIESPDNDDVIEDTVKIVYLELCTV